MTQDNDPRRALDRARATQGANTRFTFGNASCLDGCSLIAVALAAVIASIAWLLA
jgi:hypothetical protein